MEIEKNTKIYMEIQQKPLKQPKQSQERTKTTPVNMIIIKPMKQTNKQKQKISVGNGVEKLEPLGTVGENVKWLSYLGKQY